MLTVDMGVRPTHFVGTGRRGHRPRPPSRLRPV